MEGLKKVIAYKTASHFITGQGNHKATTNIKTIQATTGPDSGYLNGKYQTHPGEFTNQEIIEERKGGSIMIKKKVV